MQNLNCGHNEPHLIDSFPDFEATSFDPKQYDLQFREHNIIIKAASRDIAYPEHWGPLSIKSCASGKEHYQVGKRFYTVHDQNFLILNNGQYYSSYIYSDKPVESFTVNFTQMMQSKVTKAVTAGDDQNLNDPFAQQTKNTNFTEKLFDKDDPIHHLLTQLRILCANFYTERQNINERLYHLLEKIIITEQALQADINRINVVKASTRQELYKRLHFVKDYLDSCYQNYITLDDMAGVANLNTAYLLRKFKDFFGLTPRQYIIKKRIEIAAGLLKKTNRSVTEVCNETGYSDLTSFGKLFKQFYNCSPENYRNQIISS